MRLNDPRRDAESPPDSDQEALAQRLRTLATEMRPPFTFSELTQRARGQRRASERFVVFAGLAAAAALVGLVVVAEWRLAERHSGAHLTVHQGLPGATQERPPVAVGAGAAGVDPEVGVGRSDLPAREPAIVRVSTRLAVAGLEDRIASLDDVLNNEQLRDAHDPRLTALRRERAQMLSSLSQVRYAENLAADTP
jgi:hypothetical protein